MDKNLFETERQVPMFSLHSLFIFWRMPEDKHPRGHTADAFCTVSATLNVGFDAMPVMLSLKITHTRSLKSIATQSLLPEPTDLVKHVWEKTLQREAPLKHKPV